MEPEVEVAPDGTITAPDDAGIGVEVRMAMIDSLTVRTKRIL